LRNQDMTYRYHIATACHFMMKRTNNRGAEFSCVCVIERSKENQHIYENTLILLENINNMLGDAEYCSVQSHSSWVGVTLGKRDLERGTWKEGLGKRDLERGNRIVSASPYQLILSKKVKKMKGKEEEAFCSGIFFELTSKYSSARGASLCSILLIN
jgi:hypothetical protein